MRTNNGFISLKEMDIPSPAESKRQRYVWVRRIFPRRIRWTILFATVSLMIIGVLYCIATKKQEPILWVDATDRVQSVELPDGTIIDKQDQRVWDYIHHNPGYEKRYKSH